MVSERTGPAGAGIIATRWQDGGAGLDTETAVQLRLHLLPVFETAAGWSEALEMLEARGFRLAIRRGRLVLLTGDGEALCTARFLGYPLADLAARWGRPCVVPVPGEAAGEFLH